MMFLVPPLVLVPGSLRVGNRGNHERTAMVPNRPEPVGTIWNREPLTNDAYGRSRLLMQRSKPACGLRGVQVKPAGRANFGPKEWAGKNPQTCDVRSEESAL
jgi:hypothetical protein